MNQIQLTNIKAALDGRVWEAREQLPSVIETTLVDKNNGAVLEIIYTIRVLQK